MRKLSIFAVATIITISLTACNFQASTKSQIGQTGKTTVDVKDNVLKLNHTAYDFSDATVNSTDTLSKPYSMAYGEIYVNGKNAGIMLDGNYTTNINETNMTDLALKVYQTLHNSTEELDLSNVVFDTPNLYYVRIIMQNGYGLVIGVKGDSKFAYVTVIDGTDNYMEKVITSVVTQLGDQNDLDELLGNDSEPAEVQQQLDNLSEAQDAYYETVASNTEEQHLDELPYDGDTTKGRPINLSKDNGIYTYDVHSAAYDEPWLNIGEDLPAGTYVITIEDGQGILTIFDSSAYNKKFEMSALYKDGMKDEYYDYQPNGSKVQLNEGDQIFLTDVKLTLKSK